MESIVNLEGYLVGALASVLLGLVLAATEYKVSRSSRGFIITLAMLPVSTCTVIMMVNGSIGTGIAVAGAFSLVRFRSMPGKAQEIIALFESMTIGLACAAGYPLLAAAFTAIVCLLSFLYNRFAFGAKETPHKLLSITVPEDLQYYGMFDDILKQYTAEYRAEKVKTMNLGSLMRLSFDIVLKDPAKEKEMIDALRCRNGNLEIMCAVRGSESEL